jgi:hypothetical protein
MRVTCWLVWAQAVEHRALFHNDRDLQLSQLSLFTPPDRELAALIFSTQVGLS